LSYLKFCKSVGRVLILLSEAFSFSKVSKPKNKHNIIKRLLQVVQFYSYRLINRKPVRIILKDQNGRDLAANKILQGFEGREKGLSKKGLSGKTGSCFISQSEKKIAKHCKLTPNAQHGSAPLLNKLHKITNFRT